MKNKIISIVLLSICIFSCKKNCINKDVKADLSGKIKSAIISNQQQEIKNKYYYKYDTITGQLITVSNDSIVLFSIQEIDDTQIVFYNNIDESTYVIKHIKNQIQSIRKSSSIVTQLSFKNNKIDSIYDVGNIYNSNISYSNFISLNDNSVFYKVHYIFNLFGIMENKEYETRLTYTNIPNDNQSLSQSIGTIIAFPDINNNFNNISYYLGLNDYYIFKPNKYLIDSINTNDGSSFVKYDYQIHNNKITKQTIRTTLGYLVYDYTYY